MSVERFLREDLSQYVSCVRGRVDVLEHECSCSVLLLDVIEASDDVGCCAAVFVELDDGLG